MSLRFSGEGLKFGTVLPYVLVSIKRYRMAAAIEISHSEYNPLFYYFRIIIFRFSILRNLVVVPL